MNQNSFTSSFRLTPAFFSGLLHTVIVVALLYTATPIIRVDNPISVELWNSLPATPKEQDVEPKTDVSQEQAEESVEQESDTPSASQNTATSVEKDAIQLKPRPEKPEKLEREDRQIKQEKVPEKVATEVKPKPTWLKEKPKDPAKLLSFLEAKSTKKPDPNLPEGQEGGGTDPSYIARLRAHILQNIFYSVPPDLRGNPTAEFWVEQSQKGEVISVRLVKGSGLPGYDEAVARAIERSSPLPKPQDGTLVPSFRLIFRPKDTQ
jgi:colicin import membrane protein